MGTLSWSRSVESQAAKLTLGDADRWGRFTWCPVTFVATSEKGNKIRAFPYKKARFFLGKSVTLTTMSDEVANDAENQQLKTQNELLKRENALLKEEVELLICRIFGVKSEKLDPGQLELLLSQAEGPLPRSLPIRICAPH